MSSSKSFIYIKNSIGPNTDPCGTPLKTDFQFEISPSTISLCLLCVSHWQGNHVGGRLELDVVQGVLWRGGSTSAGDVYTELVQWHFICCQVLANKIVE